MPGDDELISFSKRLEGIDAETMPLASVAMGRSLEVLQNILGQYPPQPARDRAKTFNAYVRGVGRLPKSAFFTQRGKPRKTIKTTGAKLTSQQMDKRFRVTVETGEGAVTGLLENTASYSGWVIGPVEGDPHQVDFHRETGWNSADSALEQAAQQLDGIFDELLQEIANTLAK